MIIHGFMHTLNINTCSMYNMKKQCFLLCLSSSVSLSCFLSPLYPLQDAGSQQIGFLLGSCGVTVALTSDACHKGLPKSPTGEIPQFKGK